MGSVGITFVQDPIHIQTKEQPWGIESLPRLSSKPQEEWKLCNFDYG